MVTELEMNLRDSGKQKGKASWEQMGGAGRQNWALAERQGWVLLSCFCEILLLLLHFSSSSVMVFMAF